MRPITRFSILTALTLLLVSCAEEVDTPTISLTLAGSSTVTPLAEHFAETYTNVDHASVITVTETDSGMGITAVGMGQVDVGMASRPLKDAEKEKFPRLREFVVARDALVVITHPSRDLASLTREEIADIFMGVITDWSEVGQPAGPIVAYAREPMSGTRDFFVSAVLKGEALSPNVQDRMGNGGVVGAVAADVTSIGFTSLAAADDTVHVLNVDGGDGPIQPTEDAVRDGSYIISRPLAFITDGDPSDEAQAFFEFSLRPASQATIREIGFVPLF